MATGPAIAGSLENFYLPMGKTRRIGDLKTELPWYIMSLLFTFVLLSKHKNIHLNTGPLGIVDELSAPAWLMLFLCKFFCL